MKRRQTDIPGAGPADLAALPRLPRPVYGHVLGLSNRAIGRRHRHPWVQLSYAAKGVVEVIADGGRYMAPPRHAVWVPPGVPHAVRCAEGTEIRSLYIDPAALAAPHFPAAPDAPGRACRVLAVAPLLRELIRGFSEFPVEYQEDGAQGRLAAVLLDQLAAAPEAGLALPLPVDARLRRICRELQARPDSARTLAEHAVRLAVSEKTLSRLFQQQTGLTFRAWRQRLRILAALPLLERGERVTDVAIACGYDSMSAFIAAFGRFAGVTPGEFFAGQR
ncbi:helix-turn-helix transcriptional regulator [Massilia sp.]|uniref:AraC family transcriptional regulator n=1 Tax=Massilia sp. TaxID=1882437 RepID=UPI0028AD4341|nr:helix-turn-helix transcriptional regulator [Massilia sp.]